MKKETALIYATIVTNYLAVNHAYGYISLYISQYDIRVHYFDPSKKDDEIIKLGDKTAHDLGGDCILKIIENEKIRCKTFDITWEIDPIE